MAATKGALEEGEGGSAETGAELGEDGDGYAELSGAASFREHGLHPLFAFAGTLQENPGWLTPSGACFLCLCGQGSPNRHRNKLHHRVSAGERDPAAESKAREAGVALWGACQHQRLHRLPGGIAVPFGNHIVLYSQGHDSTLGFIKNLNRPAAEDSVVVQVLKRQGAIPFVKTNVPQSLVSYDCRNILFGQTLNPLLYTRSPGGSSGGEGALIGGGGSILGIGTDVGGSLRFPAAFCGICALKPTGNRLSKKGVIAGVVGQKAVAAAVGPMAKDVDSLALCMRALLCEDMFSLDSTVPPLPFNEEVYSGTQPLRIGYYETDFFTMPSPAMRRAVREVKQVLEDAGHTLVPFELMNVDSVVFNFCLRGMFSDGGVSFIRNFKGELDRSGVGLLFWLSKTPNWLKTVLSWTVKPFVPRLSAILRSMRANTVDEVWSLHHEIEEFCHQFITQWKKLNLDVMLCPMLGPALGIGYPEKLSVAVSYTMLYNALDFPTGVVPVTLVTDEDEEELKGYQGYFRDWWDRTLAKAFRGSVGLPVAVQCVALPWQEELCLRLMKEVETLVAKENAII
ncbi:fatty-acid amide hydrolase 1-like isoform X2 [Pogoniulus pusillus]|uniref:fatty-acid amide hydrolase 1-like isoform X2 n=1 Tax=Pogoniulus pusillus TaxID=488313 RepID=UPI0030B95E0C